MRHRDMNSLLTQGDKEYAEAHWNQFTAVISLNPEGASVGCEYLHRPVKDEDTPSLADIACWVSYTLQRMGDEKRVLVNCQAGQNRSLIIGALILAIFENRQYDIVTREIHERCLQEDPPHDWWPYSHWLEAIHKWYEVQVEQKPSAHKSFAPNSGKVPLDEALKLAGGQRPDYLTSLYKYTSLLPHDARIVELGSYKGDSCIMMACAVKGTNSHIIAIDPIFQHGGVFVPDVNLKYPGYYESSLVAFLNRLSAAGLDGYVSIVADYSQHVLKRWDGRQIDLLFVDAQHDYQGAKADAEWMQYVKQNGYAVWDDWLAVIEQAVMEYMSTHPEWKLLHKSTDAPDGDMVVTLFQKA